MRVWDPSLRKRVEENHCKIRPGHQQEPGELRDLVSSFSYGSSAPDSRGCSEAQEKNNGTETNYVSGTPRGTQVCVRAAESAGDGEKKKKTPES